MNIILIVCGMSLELSRTKSRKERTYFSALQWMDYCNLHLLFNSYCRSEKCTYHLRTVLLKDYCRSFIYQIPISCQLCLWAIPIRYIYQLCISYTYQLSISYQLSVSVNENNETKDERKKFLWRVLDLRLMFIPIILQGKNDSRGRKLPDLRWLVTPDARKCKKRPTTTSS